MSFKERLAEFFFGDLVRQEFALTPIVDAIETEQYGTHLLPLVTRDEALSVPGVMRARNMLASISTLPLVTYSGDWKVEDNPLFRQIDPTRTNVNTVADTIEDLFLYKFAYWHIVAREADNPDGYPISAEYVAFNRVSEEVKNGRVICHIDGKPVAWKDIIKFESPNPAFLRHGGRVVRRALDLDLTAAKYARNPRPLNYFRSIDQAGDPANDNAIRAFLRRWKQWLRFETTGYVPAGIEYITVDQPTPAELQLVEAQKQVNLSIANMTGLDPEDLGISTTSRTYANVTDRRQDRINETFAPYMEAIEQRLSMWDVTRRGHQVLFDLSDYMKANEKERAEVQNIRLANGTTTVNEIRKDEHRPALPPAQTQRQIEAPKEVPDETD